ncbi:MAG: hypothetical protein P1U32_05140 [Legionellaceae bacterium]|nr:hypothetical protein [Legionellaceae bacterium]
MTINELIEQGVITREQVLDVPMFHLRELNTPWGVKCLKYGLFNINDVKNIDLQKLRSLTSAIGVEALSRGLITMEHVKQIGMVELRYILQPSIINRLKNHTLDIEDLVKLDFSALSNIANEPEPLPEQFQTTLETYFEEHSSTSHPLRNSSLDELLNSNGKNNLDLLCSIDEQEREIRTNSNIKGFIGSLHLNALQSEANIDYVFTLGGLNLFDKYTESTESEREAIINSLNTYQRVPQECADKVLEGLHDHIQKAIHLVRGTDAPKKINFDEVVLEAVNNHLSSIENHDEITPEEWNEIKAEIKGTLQKQVGGLPQFKEVDNFINYAVELAIDEAAEQKSSNRGPGM